MEENTLDFESLMRVKKVTKTRICKHLDVSPPTAKKYYENPETMNIGQLFMLSDLAGVSPWRILESIYVSNQV